MIHASYTRGIIRGNIFTSKSLELCLKNLQYDINEVSHDKKSSGKIMLSWHFEKKKSAQHAGMCTIDFFLYLCCFPEIIGKRIWAGNSSLSKSLKLSLLFYWYGIALYTVAFCRI